MGDEDVLQVTLLVNDDLQKTFKRYHLACDGKKPDAFIPGESVKKTLLTPSHVYQRVDTELKPQEDLLSMMKKPV